MKRKLQTKKVTAGHFKVYCNFCGAEVGQMSARTEERANAIYDCPKCIRYYCDQCSYTKDGLQFCLRCDSKLKKVM
jgi:hypothetical protein